MDNATATQSRGYDDAPLLRAMAKDLVERKYSSVDEAAKGVLNEPAGSNVDRLRRKFREQNWYEIGLNDFVEAEIARRAVVADDQATVKPSQSSDLIYKALNAASVNGTVMLVIFSMTSLVVAAAFQLVYIELVALGMSCVTFVLLALWAEKSAKTSSWVMSGFHLALLVLVTAVSVVAFANLTPNNTFLLGSIFGTYACAAGLMLIGFYASALLLRMTKFESKEKTPITWGLALAVCFTPVLFNLFAYVEVNNSLRHMEQGIADWHSLSIAVGELQKSDPDLNVDRIKEVKDRVLLSAFGGTLPLGFKP